MKHLLCYGDSNTWGYTPGTAERYPENVRWTGRLAAMLGAEWRVHEEGLNARTTVFDDDFCPFLNGRDTIRSVLLTHAPIDLLIIALGSNDLKYTDAWHSARGAGQLVSIAQHIKDEFCVIGQPFRDKARIIVISPPHIAEEIAHRDTYGTLMHAHGESMKFAQYFKAVCDQLSVRMLDAAQVTEPSPIDGLHLTPDGHDAMAKAVYAAVLEEMEK